MFSLSVKSCVNFASASASNSNSNSHSNTKRNVKQLPDFMRNEKNTEGGSPATAATSTATDQEAPAGRIDEQTSSQVRDTLEERESGEEQLTLTV